MTVTTDSPNNGSQKPGKRKRQRRAWTPGDKDHLIYQWVKFDGETQLSTAVDFGISQATVSRIINRYERWQAHAPEREGGRLDPAERRRAQRWLTYERNERILASSLRIADRMEGVTEMHKSVRTRPLSEWHKEGTEIRSEERGVDRHGVAARFLRLAFRINMEQLKLVEQDPSPMPEPLTEAELAAEEARDAAVAEELATAERRAEERVAEMAEAPAAAEPTIPREQVCSRLEEPDAAALNLHKVHNGGPRKCVATPSQDCTCAHGCPNEKSCDDACSGGQQRPDAAPVAASD